MTGSGGLPTTGYYLAALRAANFGQSLMQWFLRRLYLAP